MNVSISTVVWSIVWIAGGLPLIYFVMLSLPTRKKKFYIPVLAAFAAYLIGFVVFMSSSAKDTLPTAYYSAFIATSTPRPPTAIPTRTPLPTPQGTPFYVPSVKRAVLKPTVAYPDP